VNSSRLPRLGSVAWADLEDANGFSKIRPVVVISPTADIALGKTVRVVAITTRIPLTLPDEYLFVAVGSTSEGAIGFETAVRSRRRLVCRDLSSAAASGGRILSADGCGGTVGQGRCHSTGIGEYCHSRPRQRGGRRLREFTRKPPSPLERWS
jgi:mRNA-degrading endonuclease toxin of MazEF toxin-antitoxin module